jgi:topoisomerase-4 subunit A
VKKTYADDRRSVIEAEIEEIKINLEVMIASEDVIVTVTKDGYVKRTSLRSYAASNGQDFGMKDSDRLLSQFEINTTEVVLLFTNKGNYLYCPVHELPDIRWKDLGQHIANIIPIDRDEVILKAIPVKDFAENYFLTFITKSGMVKKTELSQYKAQRYSKPLVALNLKGDDSLIDVHLTTGQNDLFLVTQLGYGLWFEEEEVSIVGPRAAGVKGINLKPDDFVVSGKVIERNKKAFLVIATQRGAVKKMNVSDFEKSSRAKRGLVMLRELKNNPHRIVGADIAQDKGEFYLETEKGVIESINLASLRPNDRYSNGSFVIDEQDAGSVTKVWLTLTDEKDNHS